MFMLGRASGRHLHALAHNLDPRPVQVGRRRGSIGSQHALGRRTPRTWDAVDVVVIGIVDRVTRRMRAAGRVGRTVVLRLRFDDFSRVTRSHTLPRATSHTQTILATVRWLLAAAMPLIERRGVTLVGIAVANLEDDRAVQLGLPFDRQSGIDLDAALDEVRERFGSAAVTRAVLLGRELRPSMPLLPDRHGEQLKVGRSSCESWPVVVADPYHASTRHSAAVVPFRAGDGLELNLVHIRGEREATRGPVLLVHGAGVRGEHLPRAGRDDGRRCAARARLRRLARELARQHRRARRTSGRSTRPPIHDHPAAVRKVVEETGAEKVKAIIHCQGSTSFMMSAVAGLVPEVKTIVANAVSLHTGDPAGLASSRSAGSCRS